MASLFDSVQRHGRRLLKSGNPLGPGWTHRHVSSDLAEIERQTGRAVSIASTVTPKSLPKCHSQDQSPLFALPAEIRALIFTYALTPDPWQDSFDVQICHPTCRFSTQILRTCRRIWLEANTYVLDHAAPEFFLYRTNPFGEAADQEESSTCIRGVDNLERFLRTLTPKNMERMDLGIDADMECLQRSAALRTFALACGRWPSRVTIKLRFREYTIRPTGWTPGVSPERIGKTIIQMLESAASVGITHFTLKMQTPIQQRTKLEETIARLCTDTVTNMLECMWGWSFDKCRFQVIRADHQVNDDRFDVAVLPWHREGSDARGRCPQNHIVHNCLRNVDVDQRLQERQRERVVTYLERWQMQGSLLRFDG